MKLLSSQADSNQIETIESASTVPLRRQSCTLPRSGIKSIVASAIAFGQLIIRIALNGYRPQIRSCCDRDNNIYWYAYYPISDVSKVLALDTEIKQWLELTH